MGLVVHEFGRDPAYRVFIYSRMDLHFSSLLTLVSSLLTLVSSLLTLVVSRPLPLTQGVGSTRPPCSHVPLPPPTKGVGVAQVLTPLGCQSLQLPPATASPPPWGLRADRPGR